MRAWLFSLVVLLWVATYASAAFLLSDPSSERWQLGCRQRQVQQIHHGAGYLSDLQSTASSSSSSSGSSSRYGSMLLSLSSSSSSSSFSESVAMERHHTRNSSPGKKMHHVNALAKTQQVASFATFFLGLAVGAAALTLLLVLRLLENLSPTPSALPEQQGKQEKHVVVANDRNISTQDGGSRTAIIALWARAQAFQQQSGGPDHLAPQLLQECLLSTVFHGNGNRASILQACAWLSRLNFQLTRGIFEDQIAFLATFGYTGLVTPLQCRTCWLDDCVQAFVQEIRSKDNTEQDETQANVVVLGSGYDTRCYRLPELLQCPSIRCFEVDAPGTSREKQRVLRNVGIDTTRVTFVACDFVQSDWLDSLQATGTSFDTTLPTLVLWEGVTMYLDEATVRATLSRIHMQSKNCGGAPWYIAFDYVNADWAQLWKPLMLVVKEPFQFSVSLSDDHKPSQTVIEQLVGSCGLQLMEHLNNPEELLERYVSESCPGQHDGILGSYGGFVVACTQH